MKKSIYSANAPQPLGPYSQAIEIGGLVFFSGQLAVEFATMVEIDAVGVRNATSRSS